MKEKFTYNNAPRRQRRRAFTLTEIAIVLGIVGLILGAIWAAASAVYSNLKESQAQQGITFAAQQVRSLFAASNQTGATKSPQNITSPGMFPVSWNGTGVGITGNPWNQNPAKSLAFVVGDSASPSMFGIELDNISADGCAALMGFYNSAASTLNGGTIAGLIGNVAVVVGTQAGTNPAVLTAALAAGYNGSPQQCTGVGNTNSIGIIFNMTQM